MSDYYPTIRSTVQLELEVPHGDIRIEARCFTGYASEARQELLDGLDVAYQRAREQLLAIPVE